MLAFKRSFKIKALELNRKILESAEDLKKPAVKEPTVPEGFELEIEKRLQERQATKKPQEDDEKPQNFKAKPLPKKVLERVVVSLNTDEFQSCFFIAERQILLCGNLINRDCQKRKLQIRLFPSLLPLPSRREFDWIARSRR